MPPLDSAAAVRTLAGADLLDDRRVALQPPGEPRLVGVVARDALGGRVDHPLCDLGVAGDVVRLRQCSLREQLVVGVLADETGPAAVSGLSTSSPADFKSPGRLPSAVDGQRQTN